MLDENVPQVVADMLKRLGHKADFIREYAPPGSPDPVVATVSEELDAILLSFDGDFEVISPRIPDVIDFVAAEFALTKPSSPMRLTIGASYLRTDR